MLSNKCALFDQLTTVFQDMRIKFNESVQSNDLFKKSIKELELVHEFAVNRITEFEGMLDTQKTTTKALLAQLEVQNKLFQAKVDTKI